MRGRWIPSGPESHPLFERIPCQCYRWVGPAELDGFELAFYCPHEELPRRFFCGPVLDDWCATDGGARSLDEICHVGIGVLARLERTLHAAETCTAERTGRPSRQGPPPDEAYEFYHALFRNRLLGRVSPKRRLRCKRDFIDSRE